LHCRALLKRSGQHRTDIILEVDGDHRHILVAAAVGDATVEGFGKGIENLQRPLSKVQMHFQGNEFPPKAEGKNREALLVVCLRYGFLGFG
jgi:hypothetical protein